MLGGSEHESQPMSNQFGNPVTPFLRQQGFAMLDGGLATELENRGADLDHFLWSARLLLEAPQLIEEVHHDYLAAGADIIATASYQASFDGFARAGYDQARAVELMQLSVELAGRARDRFWANSHHHHGRLRPLVAASVGPWGACLHDGSEYHGNYAIDRAELRDFHRERLDVLTATTADLLAFETIPSREEAEVLVELLAEYPEWHAWLSFSCRDGERVSHGEPFAECAALAANCPQLVAVGVNCTAPQHIGPLLDTVREMDCPRVVYPNRGEVWIAAENRWEGGGCDALAAEEWYRKGARLIGGCCRTGPDHVRAMRASLQRVVN